MAISKEKKRQQVADLKELLTRRQAVIIVDYKGSKAGQMAKLRNTLRPLNSKFMVIKNTMLLRSLQELALPEAERFLTEPTALGFCFEAVTEPARAIMQFAQETQFLKVKGGLLGHRVIDARQVKTLAELPAHEVLLAQTLAGLQSPVSHFVGVLDGVLRGLLYVLNAQTEQLETTTAA